MQEGPQSNLVLVTVRMRRKTGAPSTSASSFARSQFQRVQLENGGEE